MERKSFGRVCLIPTCVCVCVCMFMCVCVCVRTPSTHGHAHTHTHVWRSKGNALNKASSWKRNIPYSYDDYGHICDVVNKSCSWRFMANIKMVDQWDCLAHSSRWYSVITGECLVPMLRGNKWLLSWTSRGGWYPNARRVSVVCLCDRQYTSLGLFAYIC